MISQTGGKPAFQGLFEMIGKENGKVIIELTTGRTITGKVGRPESEFVLISNADKESPPDCYVAYSQIVTVSRLRS